MLNASLSGDPSSLILCLTSPFSMHSRYIIAALSLLFASTLLQAQPVVPGSFVHGGVMREYQLYVPAMYNPATPVPVVFNFHGLGSNMQQQAFYGDFRPIADTANFIIVHPNGTLNASGTRFWNNFGGSSVDDLGFIEALLDRIIAEYNVDQDRVYSTGMSNGGYMSYDLACFRSARFTAIASVTGSMTSPRLATCACTHPMPVMQIHGTADPTVLYGGGGGSVGIEAMVNHWVQFNNCNPTPTITAVPDIDTNDGCTATHYVYSGGTSGSTVEFFKITGGGHTWPGAAFNTGVTNKDIKASVEIWRFFSQYRLSELATGIEAHEAQLFSLSPNPSSDAFHLQFDGYAERTVTVANAMGQEVLTLRSSSTEVDVQVDAKGLYWISVTQNGQRSTLRALRM